MRESTQVIGRTGVAIIVGLIVVVMLVALFLGGRASAGEDEPFGGADAIATEQLEEDGHEPWFEPIYEPAGGEIESGLFALQAGLGGVVLGYVFGRLRGRAPRPESADTSS